MPASVVPPQDPNAAATTLLASITTGLSVVREPRAVRERFEEELRTLVQARSVSVSHAPASPGPDVLSFEVPAAPWSTPATLEAVFAPSQPVDEWQRRTLALAAQVAALVVRLEDTNTAVASRKDDGAAPLIGSSAAIRAVRERIERVAITDFTVMIEGESGTGKELVARQVHELSRRRRGPFVAVNCAAIVETLIEAELFGIEERAATGVRGRRGKFEAANGGTLFLDEVSDLSPAAQAKLLRAIQDLTVERVGGTASRHIDTRIIVATNRPLAQMVDQNRFRLDLYYRLNGIEVQVPPLRDRREDIVELASYFLQRYRSVRPLSLSIAVADALLAYSWPGNVRELERVIERAVALASGDAVELEDLPPTLLGGYSEALLPAYRANETMRAWGCRYARMVLERCENNKRKACRELGISYHTLQGYLRFHQRVARVGSVRPDGRRVRRLQKV